MAILHGRPEQQFRRTSPTSKTNGAFYRVVNSSFDATVKTSQEA